MISDVLMDAVEEIEELQRELPVLYDPVREEIEVLKEEMRVLVRRLNGLAEPQPEGYVARVAIHGYLQ